MKSARETPMLEPSPDVLDCIPSTARGWASRHTHRDGGAVLVVDEQQQVVVGAAHGGDVAAAFRGAETRFLVASFSSDWLFPTAESRAVVRALNRAAAPEAV